MICAEMCGSNAYETISKMYTRHRIILALRTSYAYGSGGSAYWGADIAPNLKGCCSEARTVEVKGEERRKVDSINPDMSPIMPASHVIGTSRWRVRLSDPLAVTNKVLLWYAAQSS